MTKTEILSNLGIGSGINTTELIKALVDADTAPQKENLDNLEEKTKDKISTFGILKSNLLLWCWQVIISFFSIQP